MSMKTKEEIGNAQMEVLLADRQVSLAHSQQNRLRDFERYYEMKLLLEKNPEEILRLKSKLQETKAKQQEAEALVKETNNVWEEKMQVLKALNGGEA